nr:YwqJ-related putative deaminase [Streptomyces typhae]
MEQLERDATDLSMEASLFRTSGGQVHSIFQGLSAFYEAPEAEDLFATTKPVATRSDAFADQLEKVAQALSDYATEVRPLAKKLKQLQIEASAFVIDDVSTDDDWRKDQDKVDHNNRLVDEVKAAALAFQAAEIECHNKITALVDGIQLKPSSDGETSCGTYGYTEEVLDQAEVLPWGAKAERDYDGIEWLARKAVDFGKGFVVDGIVGTVKAFGTLGGKDGWGAAGEAWTNLAKLGTGLTLTMTPLGGAFWMAKDEQLPGWLRDSRRAVVETGKGLIAYDQWGKNPARAAGLVGFNALTIVATRGAGAAAKGGAAAKTMAVVSKVGRGVDPFTYAAKGVKFAAVKVGDLVAPLRNGGRAGTYAGMADGPYRLVDEGAGAPVRPATVPDDALRYADDKGNTVYLTNKGDLLDEHGKMLQKAEDAPAERLARQRAAETDGAVPPGVRAPEQPPVLAGARAGDGASSAVGRLGEDVPGGGPAHMPGGTAAHVPGSGAADDMGRGASASHEPPGGPSHTSSAHHGDAPPRTDHGGVTGHHATDGPEAGTAPHGDGPGGDGGSGSGMHESGSAGRADEGVRLEPQPDWHGASADRMRHHRLPAVDVSRLSPEGKLAVLKREALRLAEKARAAVRGDNPGRHQLDTGCAGSLLHDNVVTVHSSTTKMHGQKLPHTHEVLKEILQRISDDYNAGRLDSKGSGHGKCAEISLISDRLHQLDPTGTKIRTVADARRALDGAVMHTRRIGDFVRGKTGEVVGRHGDYMRPCDTCKHVLPQLGIRAYE